MARKLTTTPTTPRIHNSSARVSRVEPEAVAAALGAEASAGLSIDISSGSPLSLFQVRQELLQRLRSTGGRPSLAGADDRKKIPLSNDLWSELEEIAREATTADFTPSAGQVASVLLTLSLRSLRGNGGQKRDANGFRYYWRAARGSGDVKQWCLAQNHSGTIASMRELKLSRTRAIRRKRQQFQRIQ